MPINISFPFSQPDQQVDTLTFNSEIDNGNSGVSQTIDWTSGNKQKTTLTDNASFSFTDPSGPTNVVLHVVQDGTGGRNPSWPSSVKWEGGTKPDLSGDAANTERIFSFYFDGANYYGQATNTVS